MVTRNPHGPAQSADGNSASPPQGVEKSLEIKGFALMREFLRIAPKFSLRRPIWTNDR
jgi:hypothetical protein